MATLTVNVLGPAAILIDRREVAAFRTSRARALLFYLAVEPPQTLQREALMALLWPDSPLKSAQTNLRQAVYQLRRTIPALDTRAGSVPVPLLIATRFTLARHPEAALWVDATEFRAVLHKIRRHGHELINECLACRQELEAALGLYRGPFLEDFFLRDCTPFEEWAQGWRSTLERQALDAYHALTEIFLHDNRLEQAAQLARRQMTLDPFAERALRQLLTAEVRLGRRTEALAEFEAYRALLQGELHAPPEMTTLAMVDRIRSGQAPLSEALKPYLPVGTVAPLPPTTGRFVGRAQELSAIQQLLEKEGARLLTITAPGGMGKTSLALAIAHNMRQAFPDGIVVVALPPETTAQTVLRLLADQLQLPPLTPGQDAPDLFARLCGYLQPRTMLLLLDSYEHTAGCEPLLEQLLAAAPGLTLLLTSRRTLRPSLGHVFPLQGLDAPPAGASALDVHHFAAPRLLRQAALRVNPYLVWDLDAWAAAGEISRLVGGMPLALELAASWVQALPLDVIAAEIRRGIDILATNDNRQPPRHRSITAVLNASWQQLAPAERVLFKRLSQFRGGFTREAAAAVAGPSLPRTRLLRLLASLLEKSLLTYDFRHDRYGCHDLLRQYGAQRLAGNPQQKAEVHQLHSEFYVNYLADQFDPMRSSDAGGRAKAGPTGAAQY